MANQKPDTESCDSMLFEALEVAQVPSLKAYNAVQEVRDMAGENVNAKFEVQNAKINALYWMVGGLYFFITVAMSVIALVMKS